MPAGNFLFGYANNVNKWGLNTGNGVRSQTFHIDFVYEFPKPPNVFAALSGLDTDKGANVRLTLTPTNITTTGFDLVVGTWADSLIYTVWGMWYAEEV